jgi:hypothetical protein
MKIGVSLEMAPHLPHEEDTRNLNIPRKNRRRNQVNERGAGIGQEVDPGRDTLRKAKSYEMAHPVKRTKQM